MALPTRRPASGQDGLERAVTNADNLRGQVIDALRNAGRGAYVAGLEGQFRTDATLFNCYFGNAAQAAGIGVPGAAARLDGPRASVVFFMTWTLQETLIEQIRAVSDATVLNADNSPNPGEFTRIYQFVVLRQLVGVAKAVQHELEGFTGTVRALLDPNAAIGAPAYGYTRVWPFDAPCAVSEVLLGFLPAHAPTSLNAGIVTSPIVAASALRSHLEAVIFCFDFESNMRGLQPILADDFAGALAVHKQAGRLNEAEHMWAVKTYGLLSASLHGGRILSYGEVWALKRLVRLLSQRIVGGAPLQGLAIGQAGLPPAPE
jgi:hypothetical protein